MHGTGVVAYRRRVSTTAPSARLLSLPTDGSVPDRAAHRRTEPGLVAALRADSRTRVLLVHRGRAATSVGRLALLDPAATAAVPASTVPAAIDDGATSAARGRSTAVGGRAQAVPERARWLFLGEEPDGAYLALVVPDAADTRSAQTEALDPTGAFGALVARHEWSGLRDLMEGPDASRSGLAIAAVALASWHATHEHCPRCGAPTVVEGAGWVRRCVAQGTELYPRTDPAVIMSVVDEVGDRLLLGHVAHWPERRFSTLAGFVEPGESLEDAVRREVAEEVHVEVGDVEYRGSQSWPFPASLMLAFTARARTSAIEVDGEEVTDARWFTRAELGAQAASGEVLLPGRASIARALIEDWYGGRLPGPAR